MKEFVRIKLDCLMFPKVEYDEDEFDSRCRHLCGRTRSRQSMWSKDFRGSLRYK